MTQTRSGNSTFYSPEGGESENFLSQPPRRIERSAFTILPSFFFALSWHDRPIVEERRKRERRGLPYVGDVRKKNDKNIARPGNSNASQSTKAARIELRAKREENGERSNRNGSKFLKEAAVLKN
jgi:hypothetical protein